MKRLIPLIIALALAGCAAIPNPFSKPTLAGIENSYGAVLAVAVGYHDSCVQRLIPPSCRPIVVQLQSYGRSAQTAVITARNFVRNNPTLDATSVLTAAQAAISDFQNAQTRLGVK